MAATLHRTLYGVAAAACLGLLIVAALTHAFNAGSTRAYERAAQPYAVFRAVAGGIGFAYFVSHLVVRAKKPRSWFVAVWADYLFLVIVTALVVVSNILGPAGGSDGQSTDVMNIIALAFFGVVCVALIGLFIDEIYETVGGSRRLGTNAAMVSSMDSLRHERLRERYARGPGSINTSEPELAEAGPAIVVSPYEPPSGQPSSGPASPPGMSAGGLDRSPSGDAAAPANADMAVYDRGFERGYSLALGRVLSADVPGAGELRRSGELDRRSAERARTDEDAEKAAKHAAQVAYLARMDAHLAASGSGSGPAAGPSARSPLTPTAAETREWDTQPPAYEEHPFAQAQDAPPRTPLPPAHAPKM